MTAEGGTGYKETEVGRIPSEWQVKNIDEIKAKQPHSLAMGPFGSNITTSNFLPSGIPVIRGINLSSYRFRNSNFVYISEVKADELKSSNAFPKDIVITHRGSLGQVGIIPENGKYGRYVVSQSQMKLTCDEAMANPDFIFYYLKSPFGQHQLLMNTSTTGVPSIAQPLTSLRRILVPLPDLKEQAAIANVLKCLDMKIESNRDVNRMLEDSGKVLFKHWFVDFEFPNEEGKPYKSSGGEMIRDEYSGKTIPADWEFKKIGEVLTTVLGGTPDRTNPEYWGGNVPWINSGKINEFRITEPTEYITEKGLENSATKLLPKRTTVLAITGATLGQVSLLEIDSCANQSVVGVLDSKEIPAEYIYFWIKHSISHIIAWQTGGAQQHINKQNINDSLLLIPSAKLLSNYLKFVRPIFDKIALNCFEGTNLVKIRDFLLPKLMSGKIRVPVPKEARETL